MADPTIRLASFLYGENAPYILKQYATFLEAPENVDPSWQSFFMEFGDSLEHVLLENDKTILEDPTPSADKPSANISEGLPEEDIKRSLFALMLVRVYRVRGHLAAKLDPLALTPPKNHPELDPAHYGFTEADLDKPVYLDGTLGYTHTTLREVLQHLRAIYCQHIAVEFMHSQDPHHKAWLQERIENTSPASTLTDVDRKKALKDLLEAESFEQFINTKHTGAKKFGLDGSEAFIPGFKEALRISGKNDVQDVVIGMAHRGRLNVLANVMGKPLTTIFSEFQGTITLDDDASSGDVKYHQGYSSDQLMEGQSVHLSLTANPSHLEAVDPVVLGKTRAKQDLFDDKERQKAMGVLIHGDAAFIGQGIVAECFSLSDLQGYRTGGTLHLVINNQIGFTTNPTYSRSSPYCSDLAKIVQAPIFHVNGDDIDSVLYVCRMAAEFRHQFKKDVVVDIIGYRRFGHNEGDDPSFTQPKMYAHIKNHPSVFSLYKEHLLKEGIMGEDEIKLLEEEQQERLRAAFTEAQKEQSLKVDWLKGHWGGLTTRGSQNANPISEVSIESLQALCKKLTLIPENFTPHSKLNRLLKPKIQMAETGDNVDWATAEALAFATLLTTGHGVRLTGQDSGRGTFSQRHTVWKDQENETKYIPLNHLSRDQDYFEVIDSPLSEFSVLGFEYGYSSANPKTLTLWEAQFGDFANGAQVIFDQFISSAENKWHRMSGLTILLPHGYEGQGPEHSSARPERYLQMCAEDNMQIANCTTPANYFHVLRRQLLRTFRKPLIIFTPKSLLRHKMAVSSMAEMAKGSSFQLVIDDQQIKNKKAVKRILLCTGKIYYDLRAAALENGIKDVAIIRLEQLYPFPKNVLKQILHTYPNTCEVMWTQEEPENMGAWHFCDRRIENVLTTLNWENSRPHYIGRKAAASPATGYAKQHEKEQHSIVHTALNIK